MAEVRANPSDFSGPPRAARVAVARHERAPDGDHLDLFVGPAEPCDPDARVVRCWRLPLSAWSAEGLACGRFAAREIAPHRAEYLWLAEARDLSDGRGRVEPLARGAGLASSGGGLLAVVALGRRITLDADAAVISAAACTEVAP